MPLIVNKSDGSKEVYLHTKVMGTMAVALGDSGSYRDDLTGQLAETVTSFLCRHYNSHGALAVVGSDEIHSMIKAVLSDTGYEQAALSLKEHYINRQIKRSRTEVVHCRQSQKDDNWPILSSSSDIDYGFSVSADQEFSGKSANEFVTEPWDKSVVVKGLEQGNGIEHGMARAVAALIEEKVLKLGCRRLFSSVIREMVKNELWEMTKAQEALEVLGGRADVPAVTQGLC